MLCKWWHDKNNLTLQKRWVKKKNSYQIEIDLCWENIPKKSGMQSQTIFVEAAFLNIVYSADCSYSIWKACSSSSGVSWPYINWFIQNDMLNICGCRQNKQDDVWKAELHTCLCSNASAGHMLVFQRECQRVCLFCWLSSASLVGIIAELQPRTCSVSHYPHLDTKVINFITRCWQLFFLFFFPPSTFTV